MVLPLYFFGVNKNNNEQSSHSLQWLFSSAYLLFNEYLFRRRDFIFLNNFAHFDSNVSRESLIAFFTIFFHHLHKSKVCFENTKQFESLINLSIFFLEGNTDFCLGIFQKISCKVACHAMKLSKCPLQKKKRTKKNSPYSKLQQMVRVSLKNKF